MAIMLPLSFLVLVASTVSLAQPTPCGNKPCPSYGPSPCGDKPCLPKWKPTYNMSLSTIIMPCNYSGHFDPTVASKYGIVDFDWSNEKDEWVNDSPMTCMERLLEQAKVIKDINPDTKIWVYRESVAAQPWYTDVRQKLMDPTKANWFLKFDPAKKGNYTVPPCDTNFNPPRCSELYHDQVQTPDFPKGDGSCNKPCDCGVPCGRYLWDTRNPDLVDWLVNDHLTGNTSVSNPLIDGIFLDDEWSNSGGAAENCDLKDCEHDMGLTTQDVADITMGWGDMMNRTQSKVLDLGGFDWRMFQPGAGTCDGPPFQQQQCASYMRGQCHPDAPLQSSAMMYGMGKECKVVLGADGDPLDFDQHLASFLLLRGPYAWLGWSWVGCGVVPPRPAGMDTDYGVPLSTCSETSPGSGIFMREWSKASVSVDCTKWTGTIKMKSQM
eukprot:m.55771 g.55771  ORF g.55771 m.55771 type:complete len:437 (-) comp22130_c0_seq1:171-1481(-)